MGDRPDETHTRRAALRDLLLISLAAAVLLWAGSALGVFDTIHAWLRRSYRGK